jgi:2-octaprenylphenol hydroxylase
MQQQNSSQFHSSGAGVGGSTDGLVMHADVVIVGGGAIGKAAALGLAQSGLQVILVGQPETPLARNDGWDARVYALNHQARTLLRSLRVWDALEPSRIAAVDAMVVDGDAPDGPGRLAFDAYAARVDALAWIVEDSNLSRALDAALRFAQGVRILSGRVCDLQVNVSQAMLKLESGEQILAPLIVGADGGSSWVRAHCDVDLSLRSYHQKAVVTNFACEKPHHGIAYQRFTGDQGIVALLPLPGERVSLVWSAPDLLADALMAMPMAQLAKQVASAVGGRLGTLSPLEPEARKSFPLSLLRPHAMTAPRVALVGDAAHVIHPLAGQGMNLGFADVAALLSAIRERGPHLNCGDARVLGRYARTRKEDVLLMQVATDGLARLFSPDAGVLRVARNLGLNLVDRLPIIKRQLIARALGKLV